MVQKNAKVCMYKFRYDDNASSHRCIKWTVKYGVQVFCKSSSHVNRKHGHITEQLNTLSKSIDREV